MQEHQHRAMRDLRNVELIGEMDLVPAPDLDDPAQLGSEAVGVEQLLGQRAVQAAPGRKAAPPSALAVIDADQVVGAPVDPASVAVADQVADRGTDRSSACRPGPSPTARTRRAAGR